MDNKDEKEKSIFGGLTKEQWKKKNLVRIKRWIKDQEGAERIIKEEPWRDVV